VTRWRRRGSRADRAGPRMTSMSFAAGRSETARRLTWRPSASRRPADSPRHPAVATKNRPLHRGGRPFLRAAGRRRRKASALFEHLAFSVGRTTFSVVQTAFFSRRSAFFSRAMAFFRGLPSFFAGNLRIRRGFLPFSAAPGASLEASGLLLEAAGDFRRRWPFASSHTKGARERRQVLVQRRRFSLEDGALREEMPYSSSKRAVLLGKCRSPRGKGRLPEKNGVLLDENADFREKWPGDERTPDDSARNGRGTDESGRPAGDGGRFPAKAAG